MKMKNLRLFVAIMVVFFLTIIGVNYMAFASNYDEIIIAQPCEPETMDISAQSLQETQNVLLNMVEPLLEAKGDGEFSPCLAASWEYISDKEIKFHLRRGVVFHNGDPFTAKDVKFSFDFYQNPTNKSPLMGKLTAFKGLEIIDNHTIIISTKELYAPALAILAQYLNIMPERFIETKGREEYAKHGIGTGPYELSQWVRGQYVEVKAFDRYWGEKPEIKKVTFKTIPEVTSRVSALLVGEVDIINEVPFEKWTDVKKAETTKLVNSYWLEYYIGLNIFEKPFDDVKVRQALNYAIDRQLIIDSLLKGEGKAQASAICPRTFGYDPNVEVYEYNPNKAKELLAEAGYPNGFETELSYPNNYINIQQISEAIASYLSQVGVKVTLTPNEPAIEWQKYRDKELHMYIYRWDDDPEPDKYIYPLLHSQARGYYYKNLLVDTLIDKARSIVNREEREKAYHYLCKVVHDDAPWVFLWVHPTKFGVSNDVDWQPSRLGYTKMKYAKFIK